MGPGCPAADLRGPGRHRPGPAHTPRASRRPPPEPRRPRRSPPAGAPGSTRSWPPSTARRSPAARSSNTSAAWRSGPARRRRCTSTSSAPWSTPSSSISSSRKQKVALDQRARRCQVRGNPEGTQGDPRQQPGRLDGPERHLGGIDPHRHRAGVPLAGLRPSRMAPTPSWPSSSSATRRSSPAPRSAPATSSSRSPPTPRRPRSRRPGRSCWASRRTSTRARSPSPTPPTSSPTTRGTRSTRTAATSASSSAAGR